MTNQSARDIVRAASGSNSFTLTNQWYARYWRGELYPDDWFTGGSGWLANGNLPTGNGNFYRCFYQAIGNTNSIDGFASSTYQWGVGGNAAAAFINGVANGSTTQGFMHTTTNSGGSGQAQLSALGYNLYNIVSFPLNSPVSYARPWSWDYKLSTTPADWNSTTSLASRVKLSLPQIASPYGSGTSVTRIIYDPIDQTGEPNSNLASADTILHGVGAVEMDYPSTGTATNSAFYIASGLAPQGDFGANQLAETDLSFMVRTFMDAGLYSGSAHIPQLPLFQINSGNPTNQFPSTTSAITLTWTSPVTAQSSSTWWRWAGANNQANFYTEEYPGYNTQASNTYTEAGVTLLYVPMYSADGGKTWGYINSGSASGAVSGNLSGNRDYGGHLCASADFHCLECSVFHISPGGLHRPGGGLPPKLSPSFQFPPVDRQYRPIGAFVGPRQSLRLTEQGWTLVEVMLVTAMIAIITPAITFLFLKSSQGFAADEMHTQLTRGNEYMMSRVENRLSANKHFFQGGGGNGISFVNAISFSAGAPATVAGTQLAQAQTSVTGSLDPAATTLTGFQPSFIGNSMFFAAYDSAQTFGWGANAVSFAPMTVSGVGVSDGAGTPMTFIIDIYRFYYYYLTPAIHALPKSQGVSTYGLRGVGKASNTLITLNSTTCPT